MAKRVWTFERASRRFAIARLESDGRTILSLSNARETPRLCRFIDLPTLERFQTDLETLLLKTGWSFVKFSPEHRLGGDRRGFPRLEERRRWWTDGTTALDSGRTSPTAPPRGRERKRDRLET